MKRFLALLLVFTAALLTAGVASGHEVKLDRQWLNFDGTHWGHKHGAQLSYLETRFDETGMTFLHFRVTPLRGLTRFDDMQILVDGKVAYKQSDKEKLGVELDFLQTASKHYETELFLTPPVSGFNYDTGQIKWFFTADGKKYVATWTLKDNTFKKEEVGG